MIWLLSLALASDMGAESTTDDLRSALQQQIQRNQQELTLPDAPDLYHLRYHLMHIGQVDIRAEFGSLLYENSSSTNLLGVEVRVGEPHLDNTGFGGWQNGFMQSRLPQRITDYTLQLDAWKLTDKAYKQAVEQYARKAAQFTPPPTWPGDYSITGAVTHDGGDATTADKEPLIALAKELSGAMASADTAERGVLYVGHEAGYHWVVDSEGTDVRRPMEETTLRAALHVRADDGAVLTDHVLWTVRGADALPDVGEMRSQVVEMRDRLHDIASHEPETDEYVGPVLFTETAAADLFRYLLIPQLEGTPGEVKFDSWFGEMGSSKDPVRVGRRVLPPGWTVDDDPERDPSHPGSFSHDFEGTPTETVTLVTDGIVRDVLMNRVPRMGTAGTNGHARGLPGQRSEGRVSLLEVTPAKELSAAKLTKTAIKAASSYGLDWVYLIERLEEPSVHSLGGGGGFFLFGGGEEGATLPTPTVIYKLHADGTKERVRGMRFAEVQRFVLRDILAAGALQTVDFMAPVSSGGGYGSLGPTTGMASQVRGPAVLVGEIELVPAPGDPMSLPLLKIPAAK
jgi:TldD protein